MIEKKKKNLKKMGFNIQQMIDMKYQALFSKKKKKKKKKKMGMSSATTLNCALKVFIPLASPTHNKRLKSGPSIP